MSEDLREDFNRLLETVKRENVLLHASRLVSTDLYTVCPPKAMDAQGELIASLDRQAFRMRNEPGFYAALERLYKNRDALNEYEQALVRYYYRKHLSESYMTEDTVFEYSKIENRAFAAWGEARDRRDYGVFMDALSEVIALNRERASRREKTPEEMQHFKNDYDVLLDRYDRGLNTEKLDECFDAIRDRLLKLIDSIKKRGRKIRTDFLYRQVSEDHQREAAVFLKELLGLDPERSALAVSRHGFTTRIEADDVRLTTSYIPDSFLSSIYTVLHECGHALFELMTPGVDNEYYIYDNKTLGMHESVSRFYENILGRSEAFISFIYPRLKQFFPEALYDVSERELYEAVNLVRPSLIRVDADEVTYSLHILIRYELEKDIFTKGLKVRDLPSAWNDKYKKYLGIRPSNDCDGILQDVQWTSDFGYFPVYSMGNFYGAMYFERMKEDLDPDECLRNGDFITINAWMSENVFKKADLLEPADWIRDITGKDLSPDAYIDYLEEKYAGIYGLRDTDDGGLGKELDEYVERMSAIRKLSSPNIIGFTEPGQYSGYLKENFRKIGALAKKNKDALKNVLMPVIDSGEPLVEKDCVAIQKFSEDLLNSEELENLDVSMMHLMTGRLLEDSTLKKDHAYYVRQLYQEITSCYTLLYMTSRIFTDLSISASYRERGLAVCEKMNEFLDHEKFKALPAHEKGLVLTCSRYANVFYETASGMTVEMAEKRINILKKALEIYEDDFYRKAAEDYDWNCFYFRTLENFGNIEDNLYGLKLPYEDATGWGGRLEGQLQKVGVRRIDAFK